MDAIMMETPHSADASGPPTEPESSGFHARLNLLLPGFKSVRAFATASGVSQTGLQRLLNGGEPTLSTLVALARAAQVSIEWLATGDGPMRHHTTPLAPVAAPVCYDTLGNPVDLDEFVFIPRFNLQASAGYGSSSEAEKPLFSMAFRRYWVNNYLHANPRDLSVISVKGDSMEGVLNERDVILLNHADTQPRHGLYVLRINNDLVVKRIQPLPGGRLQVSSANESYLPFELDLGQIGQDVAIVGRVLWFGRQI